MQNALSRPAGSLSAYQRSLKLCIFCVLFVSVSGTLKAQEPGQEFEALPDAPSTVISGQTAGPGRSTNKDTGKLRPFGPSGLSVLPPQTAVQKLVAATQRNFSYPALIFAAAGAGVAQATVMYPEFHSGGAAYARYLWHGFADQTVDSYTTTFVLPVILHQDSRYYRLGHGTFWKRSGYSLSRLLITRSDQGAAEFNTSEVLGSGIAASISSAYYPERERTFSIVGQRWAGNLAGDGLGLLLEEFSPEIGRAMGNVVPFHSHRKRNSDDGALPPHPLDFSDPEASHAHEDK
jgi:hypothetical protein